jgi:hypothetical protein
LVEIPVDRERLQSAAAGYPYLKGLLSVPLGLMLVLAALGNWEVGPLRNPWAFVAAAAAIGASALAVNRYYSLHFGRVTPSPRQQRRSAVAAAAGVAIMVGTTLLLRSRAAWSLDLPVNPIPAAFGALMLVYYAAVVGLRTHHVLIWGALVVAGLVPLWDGADPSNVGLVMAGAAAIVNGVLDHVALVRGFAPPASPAPGPGSAGG